MQFFMYVLE